VPTRWRDDTLDLAGEHAPNHLHDPLDGEAELLEDPLCRR
jgi:hypothetical protein